MKLLFFGLSGAGLWKLAEDSDKMRGMPISLPGRLCYNEYYRYPVQGKGMNLCIHDILIAF